MPKPANRRKTGKRIPKTAWPKGVSGNPKGRPKDGESWAAIIKAVGDMYPEDIIKFIGTDNDLGRNLLQMPKKVQMKYLITSRVFAALMFDPSSALFNTLLERVEGKVPTPIIGAGDQGEHLIRWIDETKKGEDADG